MSDLPNHIPEWVKSAKAGDKVVCIKCPPARSFNTGRSRVIYPVVLGGIYTITDLYEYKANGLMYLMFEDCGYSGWSARLFRPVSKRSTETGMTTLRRIADSAKLLEDA